MKKFISALAATFIVTTASHGVMAKGPKDINSLVDVAVAVNSSGPFAGVFDTLIALLTQDVPGRADILATLDGKGQFTVFAPTDDAFAALDDAVKMMGYCGGLADLDPALVNDVLLYHVARGRRDAVDVLDSDRIRTLLGDFLYQDSGVLTDNLERQANLIVSALNVPADNGLIHGIDNVVLFAAPPAGPGC